MSLLQTIYLAIIQGITELLPISSTGHLLLFSKIFFNIDPTLLLLTLLQFGTTISIIFAFKDILFTNIFSKEKIILYSKVCLASIPAIIAGLLFSQKIESVLYTEKIITFSLFFWGIIMIFVENRKISKHTIEDLDKVTFSQSLFIGIAQILAIIPGTSRSGVTTIAGIVTGLEKSTALKFSFLAGLPILLGSFVYEIFKFRDQIGSVFSVQNIVGIVVSCVVGFISILVLKRFSKKNFLTFFGYYRIALAIILFFFIIK